MNFGDGSPTQMMAALFGGLPDAVPNPHFGPEKRLELDLRRCGDAGKIVPSEATLLRIAEALGVSPIETTDTVWGSAVLCDAAIIVWSGAKVIVTCDMDIQLHRALESILLLFEAQMLEPEWASFVRKNTVCPWDSVDVSIAHEYSVLKTAFPSGQPFVFGPVDSDHYFYYVFDDLRRGTDCDESDIQTNVIMYNILSPDRIVLGSHDVRFGLKDNGAQFVHFAEGSYESLRVKNFGIGASNIASFETNVEGSILTLAEQIVALQPERFTVTMLMDPQSSTCQAFSKREPIGLEQSLYPGYQMVNRTTNTFEHGYAVAKVSFALA